MMKDLLVANLKCFQSKSSKEDQKTYQFRYKYAIKEYNRINDVEKRKHERQYCIAHKEEKRLREIGIAQLEDPPFTIPEWHI